MLAVDANSPYKTVRELTDAMVKKGDKASYATAATSGIVMGAMYVAKTGIKAVEVRYKDSAGSLNDMASGRIDFAWWILCSGWRSSAKAACACLPTAPVSACRRCRKFRRWQSQACPTWIWCRGGPCMCPPRRRSRSWIRINGWFKQILETEETKAFLNKFGGDPFISTPDEAQALFIKEDKAWAEYVRIAKIEPQG